MDNLNSKLLPLLLVPILAGKIPPPISKEPKEAPKCKCGNEITKPDTKICRECFLKIKGQRTAP